MKRSLRWVAEATGGRLVGGDSDATVDLALVETDSRACREGSTYVARVGEETDGHDYARAAVASGARLLVVERLLEEIPAPQVVVEDSTFALGHLAKEHLAQLRQQSGIQVVGITGSAGKTTTKDLLADVLSEFGETVAPKLSFNNEVGCPLTVLEATDETEYLVLEMGASGPGHLTYLTGIAPLDVAVVLLVGRAHLEGFGDEQTLAQSKRELLTGLVPGGTAVLNEDDPHVADMATNRHPTIFFSAQGRPAQVRAEDVSLLPTGHARFTLFTPDFVGEETLSILGPHQVSNALAAISATLALGLEASEVAPLIAASAAGSPHRMALHQLEWEKLQKAPSVLLLDDSYNANPDSMKASFATALALTEAGAASRTLLVLGEMLELGEESLEIHEEVGRAAKDLEPALVVLVGDGAKAYGGGLGSVPAVVARDPHEAACAIKGEVAEGDLVLLKGSNGSKVWQVADLLLENRGQADLEGEVRC